MNYPTWSDLNNESIVPPLGSHRSHDIGSVAVMVSCEPDIRFIKSNAVIPKGVPFFTSTLMTLNGSHKVLVLPGLLSVHLTQQYSLKLS